MSIRLNVSSDLNDNIKWRQEKGEYFGWKLSAEAFADENGVSVHEMPETSLHGIDKYGFHHFDARENHR